MTFISSFISSVRELWQRIDGRIITFTAEKIFGTWLAKLQLDVIPCHLGRIIYNSEHYEFCSCLLFEGFKSVETTAELCIIEECYVLQPTGLESCSRIWRLIAAANTLFWIDWGSQNETSHTPVCSCYFSKISKEVSKLISFFQEK
jgi:hypothetical protein